MKFLAPWGGDVHSSFGVLISPKSGSMKEVYRGREWGGDIGTYTGKFNPNNFISWLGQMRPFRSTCLFVVVPDILGDAVQTLNNFKYWSGYMDGWPLAFVAQDGQENFAFPNGFNTLFIGGTTNWKVSNEAYKCIYRALILKKNIHIGRINYLKRYTHFSPIPGSELFTCDGTRNRFDGVKKTTRLWLSYMEQ